MIADDAVARAAVALLGGLTLDAILGDPAFAWHPVRLLGRLAGRAESLSRSLWRTPVVAPVAVRARLAGASAWLLVTGTAIAAARGLSAGARALHPALGAAADILVVWASIAPADLAAHAGRVRRALLADAAAGHADTVPASRAVPAGTPDATAATGSGTAGASRGGPVRGRAAVSMLVGRDVSSLDEAGVARACVESVAESSVDGAAAPLFWAALLGPWAAFAYRAVNTMDSMFGHKDERYLHFGLVPARADDAANWLPARISSAIACAAAPLARGNAGAAFRSFFRWRLAHASPNAGHPEAAYAGALGLRLGGPSRYAEGVIDKPWINPGGREACASDIPRSTRLMYAQTILSAAAFLALGAAVSSLGASLAR